MKELTNAEYELIRKIIVRILPAYLENGKLVEEYYANILLEELTKKEYQILDDF